MPETARPIAPTLSAWRVRSLLTLLRGALQNGEELGSWLSRHPVLHGVLDEAAALGLNDLTLDDALHRLDLAPASSPDPDQKRPQPTARVALPPPAAPAHSPVLELRADLRLSRCF